VPTAGLWPGQTDEGQFGFSYKAADEILYGLYEAGLSPQELVERGLDRQAIESVQGWMGQMAFKAPFAAHRSRACRHSVMSEHKSLDWRESS